MKRISKDELLCEKTGYVRVCEDLDIGTRLDNSQRVASVMKNALGCDKWVSEKFVIFILDVKVRIIGFSELSHGGLDSTLVHMRELFQTILSFPKCAGFIVAHNHPSGYASPSQPDIELTERIYDCAQLMGIQFLDHVIVSESDFVSMKSEGYMKNSFNFL